MKASLQKIIWRVLLNDIERYTPYSIDLLNQPENTADPLDGVRRKAAKDLLEHQEWFQGKLKG